MTGITPSSLDALKVETRVSSNHLADSDIADAETHLRARALSRLRSGAFGPAVPPNGIGDSATLLVDVHCSTCSTPIPLERLVAMPATRTPRCLRCQDRFEKTGR